MSAGIVTGCTGIVTGCTGVVTGCTGFELGRGGGNPGGTLGEVTGVQDVLTLRTSLIRVTSTSKYPSGMSSRWSSGPVSKGLSSALSSSRVHFMVGPSRQVSSSIGVQPVVLRMVAPMLDS